MDKSKQQVSELEGMNSDPFHVEGKPRRVNVKGFELGSHTQYFPGDHIEFKIKGHVHGILHDGNIITHIEAVEPVHHEKSNERNKLRNIAAKHFGAK